MRTHWFTLYCRLVAGGLLAFVVSLHLLSPHPSPVPQILIESGQREIPPRIAAWLERKEEGRAYAERAAQRDAEEREKAAALSARLVAIRNAPPIKPPVSAEVRPKQQAAARTPNRKPRAAVVREARTLEAEPERMLGYAAQDQDRWPAGVINRDPRIPRSYAQEWD